MASKKKPGCICCVIGCKNNSFYPPNTHFYVFPQSAHKKPQRDKWIQAVQRNTVDGSEWQPKKHSRICSQHFIGNKKSDHPLNPSFVPKIFPSIQTKKDGTKTFDSPVRRFPRALQRYTISNMTQPSQPREEGLRTGHLENEELPSSMELNGDSEIFRKDQETQIDFVELQPTSLTFLYNRHTSGNNRSDAEVQAKIPLAPSNQQSSEKKSMKALSCGTDTIPRNVSVGSDIEDKNRRLEFDTGFHGFSSITSTQELLDLAGVTFDTFNLLLKVLEQNQSNNLRILENSRISVKDQLLLFLIKMKSGLTFTALSVLFKLHRTTVSIIFFYLLQYFAQACKKFVVWPSREVVQSTTPTDFKEYYENCRVIIDCKEFEVEQPSTVEDRVHLYSQHKKAFTVKAVVGCTPGGYISFVSKCQGGTTTDAQITTGSRILEILEPGDVVLADRDFPAVKTALEASGKGALLVMPPFLQNNHFPADQPAETYKISRIRIHIERIMQRIRTYKILDKLPLSMLPHCNDIVFMCCVLVNLQPLVLKPSDDEEIVQKYDNDF